MGLASVFQRNVVLSATLAATMMLSAANAGAAEKPANDAAANGSPNAAAASVVKTPKAQPPQMVKRGPAPEKHPSGAAKRLYGGEEITAAQKIATDYNKIVLFMRGGEDVSDEYLHEKQIALLKLINDDPYYGTDNSVVVSKYTNMPIAANVIYILTPGHAVGETLDLSEKNEKIVERARYQWRMLESDRRISQSNPSPSLRQ